MGIVPYALPVERTFWFIARWHAVFIWVSNKRQTKPRSSETVNLAGNTTTAAALFKIMDLDQAPTNLHLGLPDLDRVVPLNAALPNALYTHLAVTT